MTLPWPALSPDLSPIELSSDFLGKKIRERQCNNVRQLRNALQREWNAMPLQFIQRLVGSMRRRYTAVLQANGGHTLGIVLRINICTVQLHFNSDHVYMCIKFNCINELR